MRSSAVYTRAPQPAGRGLAPEAQSDRARGRTLRPADFHAENTQGEPTPAEAMRAHGADAAVVVAYGLILPKPILEAFPLGCFNLHASLLPRWRGAAPIHRAIMAGDARDRRDGDEDGRRPRHRRHRHCSERVPIGADATDRRTARRAGAARRRPDAARARRAGERPAAIHAASRRAASPTPPRSTRARRASTGPGRGTKSTTTAAGCRRFPAPGASSPAPGGSRFCARPKAPVAGRPATCSTTG